jgi:predicted Zn-dependent peptidase
MFKMIRFIAFTGLSLAMLFAQEPNAEAGAEAQVTPAPKEKQPEKQQGININIHREVLDNGLTVLLWENHQAPIVACRLFYTTGSVHETSRNSGIAHMLEHMLFKGTHKVGIKDSIADERYMYMLDSIRVHVREARQQNDSLALQKELAVFDSLLQEHRKLFIKNELWETYTREGGTGLNAYTSRLMTAYFVTLPRNKVELYLWLESDRMQNAVLRDFYAERDVVREERRMRVEDRPTGRYFEALEALFYENHPFRKPVIGWPSVIESFTREQAEQHYQDYYKPNNAILVLAGDFQTPAMLKQIKEYFGNIPRGKSFPVMNVEEMPQLVAKRMVERRNDTKPRYDVEFHTPAVGHPDLFALDMVEGVLNGKSGRLYKRLVEEEQLAFNVSAGNGVNKYVSEFYISVAPKPDADPARIEAIVWEELERLQKEEISPREFQKVKNQALASSVRALEKLETVATRLAYFEMYGDWEWINTYVSSLNQVTPAQVKEVSQKYFQKAKSTTGLLLPEEK